MHTPPLSTYPVIMFDLDGTLAESKSPMTDIVGAPLAQLLLTKKVMVISGGHLPQFRNQFLSHFNCPKERFVNLYLLPTCGSSFFVWDQNTKNWRALYQELLSETEKTKIRNAFTHALDETAFQQPEKIWGEQLEDRGSQMTFSALGQKTPLEEKLRWDPDQSKRLKIAPVLKRYLPEFEVRIGGTTSIDITRSGIDKAYGVRRFLEITGHVAADAVFIGDALFPGGNDEPVKITGVATIATTGPEETASLIKEALR